MALDPAALPAGVQAFLTERHLATLTTVGPDGSLHVVPVGFTYDPERRLARVITRSGSRKARNIRSGSRAALCSVDGGRWVTLEGTASVLDDTDAVAAAEAAYTARYHTPRPAVDRVAVHLQVERILGRA